MRRPPLQLEHAQSAQLLAASEQLTLAGHGRIVTYSRKVFIPLTQLCRDVCHYCTFAKAPRALSSPYHEPRGGPGRRARRGGGRLQGSPLHPGRQAGAALLPPHAARLRRWASRARSSTWSTPPREVLPADRPAAAPEPRAHGRRGARAAAPRVGVDGHHARERQPSGSPSAAARTSAPRTSCRPRGWRPWRPPAQRRVPFTTGLLIGIGETRRERLEALLALRELHAAHGHLQEIIIQNFRAKPGTRMAHAPEPPLEEHLWTLAVTRLLFGAHMSIQAPPNLQPARARRPGARGRQRLGRRVAGDARPRQSRRPRGRTWRVWRSRPPPPGAR